MSNQLNPLAIGSTRPRLSSVLLSDTRGEVQTAFQVLAATDPARLAHGEGDLWDSGKIDSPASVQVVFILDNGISDHESLAPKPRALGLESKAAVFAGGSGEYEFVAD